MIKSAILLAAGRGKRQRPYTDRTPKPLLPVKGRPTLDFVLTAVKNAGVERVCIVTNHLEEAIFEYVGDGSPWALTVTFTHQELLRGTGDALMSVPETWLSEESFMVVATDYVLQENDLLDLVRIHETENADITMSLKVCPRETLTARSCVEVDALWHVKRIVEKPAPHEITSPYAASIMFILPLQFWKYLARITPSARNEMEMQSAIQMMIEDGYKASGLLQSAPEEWDAERHG